MGQAKPDRSGKRSRAGAAGDGCRKQAAARLVATGDEPAQYVLMAVLTYLAVWPEIDHLSSITLDRDYSGEGRA